MKYAIFAGHGGSDPGACYGGRRESDYTLCLALEVKKQLETAGHTVIINRTTDADSTIDEKVRLANTAGADLVAEIHLNAGRGRGSEVFYSVSGRGKTTASRVLAALVSLGFQNRGVKTRPGSAGGDYFGIIRRPSAESILIETCFIDSDDMNLFDKQKIGRAIANALLLGKPESEKEEEDQMKRYENGSTREDVYEDTDLKKKIGSLNPYEKCDCPCIVNGKPLVVYAVDGTSRKKSGFVGWTGGVKA